MNPEIFQNLDLYHVKLFIKYCNYFLARFHQKLIQNKILTSFNFSTTFSTFFSVFRFFRLFLIRFFTSSLKKFLKWFFCLRFKIYSTYHLEKNKKLLVWGYKNSCKSFLTCINFQSFIFIVLRFFALFLRFSTSS